jgi:DNA-binding MarR family transcriptional regulator
VDRLQKEELVQRVKCDEDARGWYAEITPAGRRQFDEARETHLNGVRRLFLDRLSGEDLRRLAELWGRLGAA